MFGIGGQELILILVVALIIIGPKKLPEIAKTLGKALGEFQRATDDLKKEMSEAADFSSSSQPESKSEPKPEEKKQESQEEQQEQEKKPSEDTSTNKPDEVEG